MLTVGEHTFQIVEEFPLGYQVWNIGKNMPDGFLPLCRLAARQPFPGGRNIEPDTLKAIRTEGAQYIMAATHYCDGVKDMEAYIKKNHNAKEGTWEAELVRRYKLAIPYMKQLHWPK